MSVRGTRWYTECRGSVSKQRPVLGVLNVPDCREFAYVRMLRRSISILHTYYKNVESVGMARLAINLPAFRYRPSIIDYVAYNIKRLLWARDIMINIHTRKSLRVPLTIVHCTIIPFSDFPHSNVSLKLSHKTNQYIQFCKMPSWILDMLHEKKYANCIYGRSGQIGAPIRNCKFKKKLYEWKI